MLLSLFILLALQSISIANDSTVCFNNSFDVYDAETDKACINSYFGLTPSAPTSTFCAVENSICEFSGTRTVEYGIIGGPLVSGIFTDGVLCSNEVFGDPIFGIVKSCYIVGTDENPPIVFQEQCKQSGFYLQKDSPAIGAGAEIPGFTCPAPGHPGDGNCLEWFNVPGPDIGACQVVYLSESMSINLVP